jgi:hypothetical protein
MIIAALVWPPGMTIVGLAEASPEVALRMSAAIALFGFGAYLAAGLIGRMRAIDRRQRKGDGGGERAHHPTSPRGRAPPGPPFEGGWSSSAPASERRGEDRRKSDLGLPAGVGVDRRKQDRRRALQGEIERSGRERQEIEALLARRGADASIREPNGRQKESGGR